MIAARAISARKSRAFEKWLPPSPEPVEVVDRGGLDERRLIAE
jgi:hypothetical protein